MEKLKHCPHRQIVNVTSRGHEILDAFFTYKLLVKKKEQEQVIRRLMPNGAGFVNLGCINRMFLRKSEDDVT